MRVSMLTSFFKFKNIWMTYNTLNVKRLNLNQDISNTSFYQKIRSPTIQIKRLIIPFPPT